MARISHRLTLAGLALGRTGMLVGVQAAHEVLRLLEVARQALGRRARLPGLGLLDLLVQRAELLELALGSWARRGLVVGQYAQRAQGVEQDDANEGAADGLEHGAGLCLAVDVPATRPDLIEHCEEQGGLGLLLRD
jgi:hypothetical protein